MPNLTKRSHASNCLRPVVKIPGVKVSTFYTPRRFWAQTLAVSLTYVYHHHLSTPMPASLPLDMYRF